jgi:phosphopantetheinyl transferase
MTSAVRRTITLHHAPYLLDHRFEGRPVLPATRALQLLAREVAAVHPGVDVRRCRDVKLLRLFAWDQTKTRSMLSVELVAEADGTVRAALLNRQKVGRTGMARSIKHVEATFGTAEAAPPRADVAAGVVGLPTLVTAERLYRDCVPFGPAFQNALDSLAITPDGAAGWVRANPVGKHGGLLGSLFPLDAAFHLACVWCQRYLGFVGFPVGLEGRVILEPTRAGGRYFARVTPTDTTPAAGTFNVWLFDAKGALCEIARGVKMVDISAGRLRPTAGIDDYLNDAFAPWRAVVDGLVVLDHCLLGPSATGSLTPRELERHAGFGGRRQRSFVSGRVALKRLSRGLVGDVQTPADELETTSPDDDFPRCPSPNGANCSLAHDGRFAVAAAHRRAVGVDVETVTERLGRGRRLFASADEDALVAATALGELPALARLWTGKEAVTKALRRPLATSLTQIGFTTLGETESRATAFGHTWRIQHVAFAGHVFSLATVLEETC